MGRVLRKQPKTPSISKEDIRALHSKFQSQNPSVRNPAPQTEYGYQHILTLWEDFAKFLEEPNLFPTADWQKCFFRQLVTTEHKSPNSMIGDHLSLQTLDQYVQRLAKSYHKKYHLKNELALSNKRKPKPMMAGPDLESLLYFLWAEDKHVFMQEADRTKLHSYILMSAFTAARVGAVVVSDCYRNSNECLYYRDLELRLHKGVDGGPPEMSLTITFNLRKNERDDEGKFVKITLWEDRSHPYLCPIRPFLAIAEGHNAFDIGLEYLFPQTITQEIIEIRFRPSVLNTPFYRSSDGVTGWTYSACYSAFKSLGSRAGYRCALTSYSIRRGAANILVKTANWAETGLMLGHSNPRVLQQHYANQHIETDLQGHFSDQPAKEGRSLALRSLASQRFPGVPTDTRGTVFHQGLREHPDHVAALRSWESLKQINAEPELIKSARRKVDVTLARLRREATQKLRDEFFEKASSRMLAGENQDMDSIKAPFLLQPWRDAIVKVLFHDFDSSQQCMLRSVNAYLQLLKIKRGALVKGQKYSCTDVNCTQSFGELATLTLHLLSHRGDGRICPIRDCYHHSQPLDSDEAWLDHFQIHSMHNSSLNCPYTACLRHTNPLSTKQSLNNHLKTHKIPPYEQIILLNIGVEVQQPLDPQLQPHEQIISSGDGVEDQRPLDYGLPAYEQIISFDGGVEDQQPLDYGLPAYEQIISFDGGVEDQQPLGHELPAYEQTVALNCHQHEEVRLNENCDHLAFKSGERHFCAYFDCPSHRKPFKFRRDLKRHYERIHDKAEYFCPNIGCIRNRKAFTNENSLRRHLMQVHSQD